MASITTSGDAWIPENPGDSITGKVTNIEYVDHDGGGKTEPRTVLVVTLNSSGVLTPVWAWHKVLDGKLHRLRPAIGETLTATYLGRVKPKNGAIPWANYDVAIAERPAAEFAWDANRDASQAELDTTSDNSAPADPEPELPTDDTIPF